MSRSYSSLIAFTGADQGVNLVPDSKAYAPTPTWQGPVRVDVLERLIAGDEDAFAEVVNAYHAQVYRVAWRMLGGSSEAEDVAQEAFLKLWRSAGQIRRCGAIRAWLMRVAANLATDRLRRKGPAAMAEPPEVADDRPRPDQIIRRDQIGREIDALIAKLPERQRLALVLSCYEGFGNAETAQTLEVSVEAVESLLARARRTLKDALAGRWRDMLRELEQL